MRFMNEFDIESALRRNAEHPVLAPASQTLANLAEWADRNSDGWASWPVPARAAAKLMELIERDGTWAALEANDPTPAEYRRALTPIRTFRTKHGADFIIVEA